MPPIGSDALQLIYQRAALCRAFEEACARRAEAGEFRFPVYLSIGQEYAPSTVSCWLDMLGITYSYRQVFVQHRAHSQYLAFGGSPLELVWELKGDKRGCSGGMGGTNCLQSKRANIYGHDALLATQVPIAVGACYANKKPTICFMGDAAVEEDWALASFGWAATQKLPILFIVEDNNLSILTEKKVRRSWSAVRVAEGFGLAAEECTDDPYLLLHCLEKTALPTMILSDNERRPALINVKTTRMRWHAGPGKDGDFFDRHKHFASQLRTYFVEGVNQVAERTVKEAWVSSCLP